MAGPKKALNWQELAAASRSNAADKPDRKLQVKLVPAEDRERVYAVYDFEQAINSALDDLVAQGKEPTGVNFGECPWNYHDRKSIIKFAAISYLEVEPR